MTVNKVTKSKLTIEYDELYQQVLDATGMDLFGNKALTKYFNSGMYGKMQEIYDVIEGDDKLFFITTVNERKAMTLLVYNRHMNGGKIPGSWFRPGFETNFNMFMKHSYIRTAAFKEVKAKTLIKWAAAIELIDRYK